MMPVCWKFNNNGKFEIKIGCMSLEKLKKIDTSNITVDKNKKSYRNDPFFKKKMADAIEFIKKHPIPEPLLPKKK